MADVLRRTGDADRLEAVGPLAAWDEMAAVENLARLGLDAEQLQAMMLARSRRS